MLIPNVPVDTPEEITVNPFKVYPTITSGSITLELPIDTYKVVKVTVYDMRGSVVVKKDISHSPKYSLDVSHLVDGMYLLHLTSNGLPIGSQKITIARNNPFGTEIESEDILINPIEEK